MQKSNVSDSRMKDPMQHPNQIVNSPMMLVRFVFGILCPLISGFCIVINTIWFVPLMIGLIVSIILIAKRGFYSAIGLVLKIYALATVVGCLLGCLAKYVFHFV